MNMLYESDQQVATKLVHQPMVLKHEWIRWCQQCSVWSIAMCQEFHRNKRLYSLTSSVLPRLSKVPALLQGLKTGVFCTGILQVQDLVDDGVVHGCGLGKQCGNDRHGYWHRVGLAKRWHHRHHCIRDPRYQEACTDQHCHLGGDTKKYSDHGFVLNMAPLMSMTKMSSLCSLSQADVLILSQLSLTFVSFISRLWLFLIRASKWEISFADDLTLKMIMT